MALVAPSSRGQLALFRGPPTGLRYPGRTAGEIGTGGTVMGTLSEDAQRVVEEQRLCFVATVNDDGTPNLSPKGTIAVLDDSHLAFCNIRSPGTIWHRRRRRAIEINVVDPIGRKGYRFKGTATIIEQGEPFTELVA